LDSQIACHILADVAGIFKLKFRPVGSRRYHDLPEDHLIVNNSHLLVQDSQAGHDRGETATNLDLVFA
jgi:hypothetical protein